MRAAERARGLTAAVLAAASCLALAFACGGGEDDPVAPLEAGSDAQLIGETAPPENDAEVPLGEVCGNASGLEPNAPWPLRGGCPKRAGVANAVGARTSTLRWTITIPAAETSPAIDAEQLVWFGSSAGDMLVMSPSGIVQAAFRTGGPVRSSPVRSSAGLTVFGASDGLYAIDRFGTTPDAGAGGDAGDDDAGADDAGEGGARFRPARLAWKRPLAGIASSPVSGGDGTIYVGTTDGKLVAVASDGSAVKWSATTNDTLGSSPCLASDGTVYVGSSDRRLYAFAPDGATKWVYEAGAAILGSPVVGGDETIYVPSSDGRLHAVTPQGKSRWVYKADGAINGAPAVRAGVVYVGSDDKRLHAVSTVTGQRKWVYDTLGAVGSPVISSDGVVYVGSADGKVYAVTPSGLLFLAASVKGRVRSAPAIGDDGTVYVTSDTGIHAIGP